MRRLFRLVLFLCAAGCSGTEDPPAGVAPTVTMLSPEADSRARDYLAVAGHATGTLANVSVVLDGGAPMPATGLEEWFLLLDVASLADGSHTVSAIATDDEGLTAASLPVSFTSTANQPPDTSIWSGLVRNTDQQPVPGAVVSVFEDSRTTLADLNGRYAMVGLPRDEEALLFGSATGYADTYLPRLLANSDITFDIPLFSDAALDFIADEYEVTREPDRGIVVGFLLAPLPSQSGYAGATVALVGGSAADGPYYTTPAGGFDPALTETSSTGAFVFLNVPTGPVTVVASGGGLSFALLPSESVGESVTLLFGRALQR